MNFVKVSTYIFIVVFAIYVVLIFTILNNDSKTKKILKNISPCPDSYKISIESEPRKIRCIHTDDVDKSFNSDDYPTPCKKKKWLIKNPDHSWKGVNEYPLKYCSGNLSDNVFRSFYDNNFVFFDDQDENKRKMKKHNADRNYKFYSKSNNRLVLVIYFLIFIMALSFIYVIHDKHSKVFSYINKTIKLLDRGDFYSLTGEISTSENKQIKEIIEINKKVVWGLKQFTDAVEEFVKQVRTHNYTFAHLFPLLVPFILFITYIALELYVSDGIWSVFIVLGVIFVTVILPYIPLRYIPLVEYIAELYTKLAEYIAELYTKFKTKISTPYYPFPDLPIASRLPVFDIPKAYRP